VTGLLELYSQLESSSDSAAKLGNSAALMWQAHRARQQLRENLATLQNQASDLLTMTDDFGRQFKRAYIDVAEYCLDGFPNSRKRTYKRFQWDIVMLVVWTSFGRRSARSKAFFVRRYSSCPLICFLSNSPLFQEQLSLVLATIRGLAIPVLRGSAVNWGDNERKAHLSSRSGCSD
jgi:hypothetical protein